MSILTPKNMCLARLLRTQSFYSNYYKNALASLQLLDASIQRNASTTSSSKGIGISLPSADLTPSDKKKSKLDLTFEDSKTAFKAKSNLDLLRGYLVFQLCSIPLLVDNQKKL